jgi:hypothetical protein
MPRRNPKPMRHSRFKSKGKKRPRAWHRGPAVDRQFLAAARATFREAA